MEEGKKGENDSINSSLFLIQRGTFGQLMVFYQSKGSLYTSRSPSQAFPEILLSLLLSTSRIQGPVFPPVLTCVLLLCHTDASAEWIPTLLEGLVRNLLGVPFKAALSVCAFVSINFFFSSLLLVLWEISFTGLCFVQDALFALTFLSINPQWACKLIRVYGWRIINLFTYYGAAIAWGHPVITNFEFLCLAWLPEIRCEFTFFLYILFSIYELLK